jgi:transposase
VIDHQNLLPIKKPRKVDLRGFYIWRPGPDSLSPGYQLLMTLACQICVAKMERAQRRASFECFLAQIVIDKYVDHLPLHRQMQRFERAGVKLAYSTLTDWVSSTCHLITPLFEALFQFQENFLAVFL